jgi:signal transduction histidine kinase
VARLEVGDTGVGIPAQDMPATIEQLHPGRNAAGYEGSGLGLAIVRATAELQGGSVCAKSDGSGSRYELTLPWA